MSTLALAGDTMLGRGVAAGDELPAVGAPTLLIVGGDDPVRSRVDE